MAFIRFPWVCVVLIVAATTVLLFTQARHLSFDSSTENFLNRNDPIWQSYMDFEEKYGLSAYFIVLVRDQNLFSKAGIERIRHLREQFMQHVPHTADIESIENTRHIHSEGDDIRIEPLFAEDLDAVDFAEKKQIATSTPYYLNRLINQQGDTTAIIVRLRQYEPERLQMYQIGQSSDALQAVVDSQQSQFQQQVLVGGSPTIAVELTRASKQDMLVFSIMAAFIVALVQFALFRRLSAVVMPLACLGVAIAMVLSIMAWGHYPVQVSSAILPSFLMAVCLADAIHFLRSFYPAYDQGMAKREAIKTALDHTGVAMFFTTLTTSVGMFSFSTASVAPVASLGLFAALGVWMAFLLTVICLPSLLLICPLQRKAEKTQNRQRLQAFCTRYIRFISQYAWHIITVGLVLLGLSIVAASKLSFSHDPLQWFAEDHPLREINRQIESSLSGTMQVEVLISNREKPTQPLDVEQLHMIDSWLSAITAQPQAGIRISSSVSVLDILKEANQILVPEEGYRLTDSQALLSQQVLLLRFDPDNTLDQLIDYDFTEMRVTLSIPWTDAIEYTAFFRELEQHFSYQLGEQLAIDINGMANVSNRAFHNMVDSMASSYINAGIIIMLLLMMLIKSLKLGLMLILPNLLPITMVLALMYLLAIPLDLFTMLIGSIAIGLIVDDAIHFVYTFQRNYARLADAAQALVSTLVTTGTALVSTTLVLCSGFLIYCFSALENLLAFGLLTALCIALALVADLLIMPAILLLLYNNNKAVSGSPGSHV